MIIRPQYIDQIIRSSAKITNDTKGSGSTKITNINKQVSMQVATASHLELLGIQLLNSMQILEMISTSVLPKFGQEFSGANSQEKLNTGHLCQQSGGKEQDDWLEMLLQRDPLVWQSFYLSSSVCWSSLSACFGSSRIYEMHTICTIGTRKVHSLLISAANQYWLMAFIKSEMS